ncbi:MAG: MogA/MoaB family molybdenum cofactor biosynthesis protein [Candidatus Dormibacteria bacterium]
MYRAAVLTISDAAARGARQDSSGELIVERLRVLPATVVERRTVPDDVAAIRDAVIALSATADLLVATGGTGLGPRDVTPEAIGPLLELTVPGMAEAMRAAGLRATPLAMLSRQVVGVRGRCLVISLPGSSKAVAESLAAIWEALPHALAVLGGAPGHGQVAQPSP